MTVYNTDTTVAFEAMLRYAAQQAMGTRPPLEGPLAVTIEMAFSIPPSTKKKLRRLMEAGIVPVIKRPDIDNLQKAIFDAMNGIVYRDDAAVFSVNAVKKYALKPCVKVVVKSATLADLVDDDSLVEGEHRELWDELFSGARRETDR